MFRLSGFVSIAIACLLGVALFWTSQSVQKTHGDLKEKQQLYTQEKESLRVLSSEWSYLNRPDRIEALMSGHADEQDFGFVEVPSVVSEVSAVPEPVMPVLPSIKPAYLREVSSVPMRNAKKVSAPTIQNSEKNEFNALLKTVTEGDR